jgi:hypothetical protein
MEKFSISATFKNSYNILYILKRRNTNKISGLQFSVAFYAVHSIFFLVYLCVNLTGRKVKISPASLVSVLLWRLEYSLHKTRLQSATQKFPKLECRSKTACSIAVRHYVSWGLLFVNHLPGGVLLWGSVCFSVHFCDVVLVLFTIVPTWWQGAMDLHQILLQTRQDGFRNTQNA